MTTRDPPRIPPDLGAWRPESDDPTRPSQRGQRPTQQRPGDRPAYDQQPANFGGEPPRAPAPSGYPPSGPRPLPAAARPNAPQGYPQAYPQAHEPQQNLGSQPNYAPHGHGAPSHLHNTQHLPRHLQRLPDGRPMPIGGGRPHRGPQPPRRRGLKIAMVALGVLLLLPTLAVIGLSMFFPLEPVKAQLIAEVKKRTGRDLTIAGSTSLKFFPAVALAVKDVTLSAPPGMGGTPTLRIESVAAELKLWPLLKQRVELDRLVLTRPEIDLRVDKRGRRSWDFVEVRADAQPEPTLPHARPRFASAGGISMPLLAAQAGTTIKRQVAPDELEKLAIGNVTIVEGQVRYLDERLGLAHDITAINAVFSAPAMDAPLAGEGSAAWRGDVVRFKSALAPLRAVVQGSPADLTVNFAATRGTFEYQGRLVSGSDIGLDGMVTTSATSIRALAEWLGAARGELPKGPLSLSARLRATGSAIDLRDMRTSLDGLTATGNLAIATPTGRPKITGELTIPDLDLNRLAAMVPQDLSGQIPQGAQPRAAQPRPAAPQQAPAPPGAPAKPQSIEDLINQTQPTPQVRGFTGRAGWSDQAIDLAAFGLVNVDLKVNFGRLAWKDIKTGAGATHLRLDDRLANLTISDLGLYSGRAKGTIDLDARAADAADLRVALTGDGIALMPLLKDAGSAGMIDSRGRLVLDLKGRGLSERQIVENLGGTVQVALGPGAIHGFSLEKALQGLSQGRMPSGQPAPGDKTPFTDASITFQIANGIAESKDLRITAPLGTATGAGRVDLPKRQIDYLVRPKLAPGAGGIKIAVPGLNTQVALQSVEIPVRVRGDFDRPQIVPEFGNLTRGAVSEALKDPNRALETAKDALKGVDQKAAGDAIRGALSGDGDERKKARDVLRGILKR